MQSQQNFSSRFSGLETYEEIAYKIKEVSGANKLRNDFIL